MKIAFLFLTRDDINFPNIWEKYFKGNENNYNIYFHPKNPENVNTLWLKNNIIPTLVETGWGYIVNAYYHLLFYAYQNKENIKFITISESCVPLRPFTELYDFLINDNPKTSYIRYMKLREYEKEQRINSQPNYEKLGVTFVKHYARFCLSRYHCKKIIKSRAMMKFFIKMHIGDEHFLSILKNDKYIKNYEITFDNWEKVNDQVKKLKQKIWYLMDNNGSSDEIQKLKLIRDDIKKNPYTYTSITNNDIIQASKSKAFFWRKMAKDNGIDNNDLYNSII